jgi:selenocysteine-specific elongation factor
MSGATPLTLGTAGHVDHGKTALVRALTGVDTDRLAAERERGISIELGYAPLELPSGRTLSLIDVPGHERFVATMVAGATGIDLFLMALAADDGVMPQTREHAAVLRALGIEIGVVAVTKIDLAAPAGALAASAELWPAAAAIPVNSLTGEGLDELRAALDRAADGVRSRALSGGPVRLHIDRVFTIRGAGTVVTGTLWSGTIARGDELTLLPAGAAIRVRGVQIHDAAVQAAAAGQRVAVNLAGVRREEVTRGDVLAAAEAGLQATYRIDAALSFEPGREPEHGDRVQVHHGTRAAPARLAWLGGRFWQLRLEQPLLPSGGDRLVVRRIAPPDTLGGGVVLDPSPARHGPGRALTVRLEQLARGERPESPSPSPPSPPVPAPPPERERTPEPVRAQLVELASRCGGQLTLAQARDALQISREEARRILQQLGDEQVFVRRGDVHVLRRPRRPGNARGNPSEPAG